MRLAISAGNRLQADAPSVQQNAADDKYATDNQCGVVAEKRTFQDDDTSGNNLRACRSLARVYEHAGAE